MSAPYANLTGIDYSDSKKKYLEPEAAVSSDSSDYERYSSDAQPEKNPTSPGGTRGVTPLKLYIAFMVFAALMIVWVWEATVVQEGLTRIERLKDAKLELEKGNEAIRVDITRLSAFERIEKIAREQIGLTSATHKPGVIWVDPELLKRAEKAAADRKHE